MSDPSIHALLSAYLLAYVGLAFGWRSYRVYRRTHRNPFVLATGDDADGYVGRAFRATFAVCLAAVMLPAVMPATAPLFGPLTGIEPWTRMPGALLLAVALVLVVVAQVQMGASWRVGIDRTMRTELVEHGLFARSRNPIFLGMRVTLLGLFCVIPSAAMLGVLVAGDILMQVQVWLEEASLAARHGESYSDYRARVPRWL